MAFEKAETKTPTSIGELTIKVTLDKKIVDEVTGQVILANIAEYDVEVLDQDGNRMRSRGDFGDLINVLTDQEKTQLKNFMQAQKDKAITAFIG